MDDNPPSFNWGLHSLELDATALANGFMSLRSCEIRFKDGADLSIPNGSNVDTVDIRSALASRGWVEVYLTTSGPSPGQASSGASRH